MRQLEPVAVGLRRRLVGAFGHVVDVIAVLELLVESGARATVEPEQGVHRARADAPDELATVARIGEHAVGSAHELGLAWRRLRAATDRGRAGGAGRASRAGRAGRPGA